MMMGTSAKVPTTTQRSPASGRRVHRWGCQGSADLAAARSYCFTRLDTGEQG